MHRFTLYFWILALPILLWSQSGIDYSYLPKKVYEHQVFPVTVISTAKESNNSIESLSFDALSPQKPLFEEPLILRNGNDTFYTFYFKAGKLIKNRGFIQIPRLFIKTETTESTLDPVAIPILSLTSLHPLKDFSNVLAASMRIKNYQVSNFDTKNHLVTISLEAYEANLEDINVSQVLQSGIESLRRDQSKVTGDFFVVLPATQKAFSFSYFNTVKRTFETLSFKTELANASVTTQSDLNPKVDAFERLKRYTLITLALFFSLMFLWRRDFFYLLLGAISLITLTTFYIPHKKICVKQGAPLYILPTDTSTITTHVGNRFTTALLGERGAFKKIELKKGVIGWIKDEDICK